MLQRKHLIISLGLTILLSACAHRPAKNSQAVFGVNVPQKKTIPFTNQKSVTPDPKNALLNFFDAHFFEMQEKNDAAIEAMQKAIAADPNAAFLHTELARYYAEVNELEKGLDQAQQAQKLDPTDSATAVLLGKLYSLKAQSSQAVAAFERALHLSADNDEAYKLLTREHLLQKNYHQAILVCEQWIKALPRDKWAYYSLSSIYATNLKNVDKSAQSLKRILVFDPDDVRTLASLARLYTDNKKSVEAEPYLLRLEKLAPGDMDTVLRTGILYFQLKKYDLAEPRFLRALEQNPASDQVLYYLGLTYEIQKKIDAAANTYSKISSSSSLHHDAFIRRTLLLYDAKKYDQLINDLRAQIAKKADADYYDILASVYIKLTKYDAALAVLKEARAKLGDQEKILFSTGVLYEKMGDDESSLIMMEQVLKVNPNNPLALNSAGYFYAERGDKLELAKNYIERSLKVRPDDGYVVDSLGWYYYQMGDYQKALFYLKRADQLAPNEYILLDHLGDVSARMGNTQAAQNYYRRAVKLLEAKTDPEPMELRHLAKIKKKLILE